MGRPKLDYYLVVGIAIRLACLLLVVPTIHTTWFLPFLDNWTSHFGVDPWTTWLDRGGDPAAFPYGSAMILLVTPTALAARVWGESLGSSVLLLTFLLLDLFIYKSLKHGGRARGSQVSWILSPIVIFGTYVHGQTDLIVGLSVLVTLQLLRSGQWRRAGIVLAIGALSKLSVLLVLPFLILFVIRNPRYRVGIRKVVTWSLIIFTLGMTPILYSSGFRTMVLQSRESGGLFDYSVPLGRGESFLVVPVIYTTFLYLLWRMRRTTLGVFVAFTISGVGMLVLLAPSSIGWYLWFLPALLYFSSGLSSTALTSIAMMQISATVVAVMEEGVFNIRFNIGELQFALVESSRFISLLQTATLCTGVAAVASYLRRSIKIEDPFKIYRFPLSIGIAGDSGTGKDTLTSAIANLFPIGMSQKIEGDDYHLYERGAPEWNALTHLNPLANDLERLRHDALKARDGETITAKSYDHSSGRFRKSEQKNSGDLLLINGLHALYIDHARDVLDLRVFLAMDDLLRENLKMKRDSISRGASISEVRESISRRRPDSQRFIDTQRKIADILFETCGGFNSCDVWISTTCTLTIRGFSFPSRLSRAMSSLVLIGHSLEQGSEVGELILTVDTTDISSFEFFQLSEYLLPEFSSAFLMTPKFESGLVGMQTLVVLLGLAERRRGNGTT